MTPEVTIEQWEKYLRTRIASEQSIRWVGVRQLLDELDRLRAENEKIREFARTLLKQIRGDDE